jgi:hypothetical protein
VRTSIIQKGRFAQEQEKRALNKKKSADCLKIMFGLCVLRDFTIRKTMTETQRLLADYAVNRSETAFCELTVRFVDLVYSTALRLVDGDTHLAEDISQQVFIRLSQNAGQLAKNGQWKCNSPMYRID